MIDNNMQNKGEISGLLLCVFGVFDTFQLNKFEIANIDQYFT